MAYDEEQMTTRERLSSLVVVGPETREKANNVRHRKGWIDNKTTQVQPGEPLDGFVRPDLDSKHQLLRDVDAFKILEFRVEGKSVTTISKIMGMTVNNVSAHLQYAMDCLSESTRDAALEMRDLETQRLDMMLEALWPFVVPKDKGMIPDPPSVSAVLRIMERRAKMYGLDDLGKAAGGSEGGFGVDVVRTIASNEDTNRLAHELLSNVARIAGGSGVDDNERGVSVTETRDESFFDFGGSDDGEE